MTIEGEVREPASPRGDADFRLLRECGDPVMAELVDRIGPLDHAGLAALFGSRPLTLTEFIAADEETLREAGLSQQKIAYLRDLAARVQSGELELEALHKLPDDEVSEKIAGVKGLGCWSADMVKSITATYAG